MGGLCQCCGCCLGVIIDTFMQDFECDSEYWKFTSGTTSYAGGEKCNIL